MAVIAHGAACSKGFVHSKKAFAQLENWESLVDQAFLAKLARNCIEGIIIQKRVQ